MKLNKLKQYQSINVHWGYTKIHNLVVFLFMPLQQIQIVCWKAAEGTHKGLSCVGLPYVGIATILQPPNHVALRAGPFSFPPKTTITSLSIPSCFTGDCAGLLAAGAATPSIGTGTGAGVWRGVSVSSSLWGYTVAVAGPQPLQSPQPPQTMPTPAPPSCDLPLFSPLQKK